VIYTPAPNGFDDRKSFFGAGCSAVFCHEGTKTRRFLYLP
jgi:hypothetical protein